MRHLASIEDHAAPAAVRTAPERASAQRRALHADATYLITGGLGGAGLALCEWMVERGARQLALVGRSGGSAQARATLERVERRGARVAVASADVSSRDELDDALAGFSASLPPLRGVVHAAGVLEDGILLRLEREQLRRVMAPKVAGAWNLHCATLRQPLDFFVLFASGAGLLGSPGQASYAAANAFLDALAQHRRARGLPAQSIDWTYWVGFGMAASPEKTRLLQRLGIAGLTRAELLEAFDALLAQPRPQIAVLPVEWRRFAEALPARDAPSGSLLRGLLGAADAGGTRAPRCASAALLAADPAERLQRLQALLAEQVGRALGLPASRVDLHLPLTGMGLDSLMAVELKNRLELETGVAVPVATLLEDVSLAELASRVLERISQPRPETAAPGPPCAIAKTNGSELEAPAVSEIDAERAERLLATLGDLPDAAVDTLLTQLLESYA